MCVLSCVCTNIAHAIMFVKKYRNYLICSLPCPSFCVMFICCRVSFKSCSYSGNHSLFSKIYNIVDDDQAPREEVFAYARYLVENKWPGRFQHSTPHVQPELSTDKATPCGEKRVTNRRLKTELGLRLIHPSYRSGLQNIIEQTNINVL